LFCLSHAKYIILIDGFPDKALNSYIEALYVTDYFVDDYYTISVFSLLTIGLKVGYLNIIKIKIKQKSRLG
jgi:hypothetical protein